MDVTRQSLHGTTPYLSHREPLRADVAASLRAAAATPTVDGGGHVPGAPHAPLDGPADGPDVLLPTGVRIRRKRIGAARVGMAELQQAIRGVQSLPIAHQQLLARSGIPIELMPVAQLEAMPGKPLVVGATQIDGPDGSARPTRLRIAAYQSQLNTSVAECVQHEVGHVIAVIANQDLSEATAERYARTY